MHLFLTFSAALGNMSKLYCTRLHENWLRLGIIQVNLASALALHKRSFSIVLCSTGALFAGYVLLVSLPRPFVISTGIPVAPQLWDNDNQGDKNNYLACMSNYKGQKFIL